MDTQLYKRAILTLLEEGYVGPPEPQMTWFASNERDSGVLGTVGTLPVDLVTQRPDGFSHSIAEHVAHLRFALETALRFAKGDMHKADWESSWNTGMLDDTGWKALQQSLRDALASMVAWVEKDEQFTDFESVCGFSGVVAHGAYHLAAIRQLAALLTHQNDQ